MKLQKSESEQYTLGNKEFPPSIPEFVDRKIKKKNLNTPMYYIHHGLNINYLLCCLLPIFDNQPPANTQICHTIT